MTLPTYRKEYKEISTNTYERPLREEIFPLFSDLNRYPDHLKHDINND